MTEAAPTLYFVTPAQAGVHNDQWRQDSARHHSVGSRLRGNDESGLGRRLYGSVHVVWV